jgi:hypothetical protein
MAKKAILRVLTAFFILAGPALAQANRFGIGLCLFEPSGLSAKAWLSRQTALDAGIGWSAEENHYLHIHADFVFYNIRLAGDNNLDLAFYLGAGGKIIFRDYDRAWFRFPLGLDFMLKKAPLNFFFEVIPSFNFSKLKLFGAVGFRYLFNP